MKVTESIAELLLQYDYVIIPLLGTITSEEKAATIHPVQYSFLPPQKIFVFDPSHMAGDDLLVEMISKKEMITKEEATKGLLEFTEEVRTSLKEKGAFELNGIGKFYFDIEKKLQFTSRPDKNYLLSSFGLPEFISKPVLHPENIPAHPPPPKLEKKKRRFIWFRF